MSNRVVEPREALDQFAPEVRGADTRKPTPDGVRPVAPARGVPAFLGWVAAMCVHPMAAWRRLTKPGRAIVLAAYGLIGYAMGTLALLTLM